MTTTKPHGLLFGGDMIAALLNTKPDSWPAVAIDKSRPFKFQTRRLVKPLKYAGQEYSATKVGTFNNNGCVITYAFKNPSTGKYAQDLCNREFHKVGSILYAKETWCRIDELQIAFKADDWTDCPADNGKWKPSIFMPRTHARLWFEVMNVRVERVHDIGKDGRRAKDVLAEGISKEAIEHWEKWLNKDDAPAHTYGVLWESINGKGSWTTNPLVWVYELKREQSSAKARVFKKS